MVGVAVARSFSFVDGGSSHYEDGNPDFPAGLTLVAN
jgi:hypothetical protein